MAKLSTYRGVTACTTVPALRRLSGPNKSQHLTFEEEILGFISGTRIALVPFC